MPKPGETKETALKVESASSGLVNRDIYKYIEDTFGKEDGEYFIHNETEKEDRQTGKKYKILMVEDKDNKFHQVWFDITNWRP